MRAAGPIGSLRKHPQTLLSVAASWRKLGHIRCRAAIEGGNMAALRFIGVDPETPNTGSPTVWVDEDDDSIVIQGWRITDEATLTAIHATKPIPDHETVIRLPRRMAPFLIEVGSERTDDV
jgi:hypothetical protein